MRNDCEKKVPFLGPSPSFSELTTIDFVQQAKRLIILVDHSKETKKVVVSARCNLIVSLDLARFIALMEERARGKKGKNNKCFKALHIQTKGKQMSLHCSYLHGLQSGGHSIFHLDAGEPIVTTACLELK